MKYEICVNNEISDLATNSRKFCLVGLTKFIQPQNTIPAFELSPYAFHSMHFSF